MSFRPIIPTLLSTLLLTACGGGDSSTNTAPNQTTPPPIARTALSGTLTLTHSNNATPTTIQPRETVGDVDFPAFQSITTLHSQQPFLIESAYSSSLYADQSLVFGLDSRGERTLTVDIDPISHILSSVVLKHTTTDLNQRYRCDQSYSIPMGCDGVNIDIDALTGQATLKFSNTQLEGDDDSIRLDGTLIGTLSQPPTSIDSTPKNTQNNLFINGNQVELLAASYTDSAKPTQGPCNNQCPLGDAFELKLVNGQSILASMLPSMPVLSLLVDDSAYPQELLTNYKIVDSGRISTQDFGSTVRLNFDQAVYTASVEGQQQTQVINGSVSILKPTQTLSISPALKTESTASVSTPSHVQLTLINHQDVILEDQGLTVRLRDGEVESVQFESAIPEYSESGFLYFEFAQFGCQKLECKGIQVNANGFGVRFNNMTLTQTTSNALFNSSIQIKGALQYQGR